MDTPSFEALKEKTKLFYDGVGAVYCPALEAKVHFTSEGFNHLKYSKKRERPRDLQEAKLKLVPKGKKLLERTATLQEYCDGLETVRVKRYKKTENLSLMVQYYGFIAIIDGTRLKIVVRRVDNKQYMFWSTIPLWRSMKYDKFSVIDKSVGDLTND